LFSMRRPVVLGQQEEVAVYSELRGVGPALAPIVLSGLRRSQGGSVARTWRWPARNADAAAERSQTGERAIRESLGGIWSDVHRNQFLGEVWVKQRG
jgi:hypothetical protein